MANTIQSVRGMSDILPQDRYKWQFIEQCLAGLASQYGYQSIAFPYLEQLSLFKRSIGEETDIVAKEMYVFTDRNGDELALRPEGTAPCVRAALQHGLLYNQIQKLWYYGPMFRHERPQKGRLRQFYQFGLEAFGVDSPDVDAELIAMMERLWKQLGVADQLALQINTLGTKMVRDNYRAALVAYLSKYESELDEDSQRRLSTNPLRILDSKCEATQKILQAAPTMTDFWDGETREHFTRLCELLDALGISYTLNPGLVRGLDYYCKTVFEWVTDSLGAQGTVCAGGRYDNLVEQIGGKPTPAVGLSMGIERLLLLLEATDYAFVQSQPHAYAVLDGSEAQLQGLRLSESLRNQLPQLRLMLNQGGGSFKSQFKKADKSGASMAFIIGEDELKNQHVVIKFLRDEREQMTMAITELPQFLQTQLKDLV